MKETATQLDITGDDVYQYEMLEGVVCSHCNKKNTVEVSISINVEVVTLEEDEDDLENVITCANCDTTVEDYNNWCEQGEGLECFYNGMTWFCSVECYDEHTKYEG
jgi:hypothetical protein